MTQGKQTHGRLIPFLIRRWRMMWIRNKLREWLGLQEINREIETLYSEVAMLKLEMEDQMERLQKQDPMDSPNSADPKDIPTEDTPDAHLGAF